MVRIRIAICFAEALRALSLVNTLNQAANYLTELAIFFSQPTNSQRVMEHESSLSWSQKAQALSLSVASLIQSTSSHSTPTKFTLMTNLRESSH